MCGFVAYQGKDQKTKNILEKNFNNIQYRGPDESIIVDNDDLFFGFHRLQIMDLSGGSQPFDDIKYSIMCNGEIYNYKELKKQYMYPYQSNSDCEVLIPMYDKESTNMFSKLDAEFALAIFDKDQKKLLAARDPIGIRPLFYTYNEKQEIIFSSEAKSLLGFSKIEVFPPGFYYDGEFKQYTNITKRSTHNDNQEKILKNIKDLLVKGVEKRLDSDAPLGFLLSGGLDSSLVCAIAAKKMSKPLVTFSIGMETDPIDLKYAKQVSDFIGSDHHEVRIKSQDIEENLKTLIYKLETWDITTIRASMGMYLLCQYIREKTSVRALLTGEISDELFGYKYTDYAPNEEEFQKESEKRIEEIHRYDVLRADRCIAGSSLEARVPFGDLDFVKYVLAIHPNFKMNNTGIGKFLLRKAFEGDYLPEEILYREKAAFSDAVGHSLVDHLKILADEKYSDKEFQSRKSDIMVSKESLLYFDIFQEYFPNQEHLIPGLWLPNRTWENCDVIDPSARVLPNYGKSGD